MPSVERVTDGELLVGCQVHGVQVPGTLELHDELGDARLEALSGRKDREGPHVPILQVIQELQPVSMNGLPVFRARTGLGVVIRAPIEFLAEVLDARRKFRCQSRRIVFEIARDRLL